MRLRSALTFAAIFALPLSLAAQDDPRQRLDQEEAMVTVAEVQSRMAAVASIPGLDEAKKTALKGIYQEALDKLKDTEESAKVAARELRQAAEAPATLKSIREELSKPPKEPKLERPAEASLRDLEQSQSRVEAELKAARESLLALKEEGGRRSKRRTDLNELAARLKQELATLDPQLLTPLSPDASPEVQAGRIRSLTQRKSLKQALLAAEAELSNYDARRELLPARIDQASRRVAELEKLNEAWQALIAESRKQEAAAAEEAAKKMLAELTEQVKKIEEINRLAESNTALANRRTGGEGIANKLAQLNARLTETSREIEGLEQRYRSAQRRVKAAGLTNAIGLLLRKQYQTLPDVSELEAERATNQEALSAAEFQLIELEEERSGSGDPEAQVRELMERLGKGVSLKERGIREKVARELYKSRQKLLDDLIQDTNRYFNKLEEFEQVLEKGIRSGREYRSFIEERILWVQSVTGSRVPNFSEAYESLQSLFGGAEWSIWAKAYPGAMLSRWYLVLAWLMLIAASFVARVLSRGAMARGLEKIGRPESDSLTLSLNGMVLTGVRSLPWPLTLWAMAWSLTATESPPAALLSVAAGMRSAALALFALEVLRKAAAPRGLCERHFLWPEAGCAKVRQHLRWYAPLRVALTFLVIATDVQSKSSLSNDALGRVAFMVNQAAMAVFLHRCLRPGGAMLAPILVRHSRSWLSRLRYLGFPATVVFPMALAVLSLWGYHYSALQLESRAMRTIALILALVFAYSLLLRWLRIAENRLLAERPHEIEVEGPSLPPELAVRGASGTEIARPELPTEPTKPAEPVAERSVVEEVAIKPPPERVDLISINEQAQQLFRSLVALALILGIYAIWFDVLPALRQLDQVQIWPELRVVKEIDKRELDKAGAGSKAPAKEEAGPSKSPSPAAPTLPGAPVVEVDSAAEPTKKVITLADLGLGLIFFVFTVIAARNVPALLEIVLLQRLPVDSGGRYAISTLTRYVILIAGISAGVSAIGLDWSRIQWLAAALTFGLAFGLQEIFANFISGIILLFERPIRIGDIVTIGDITGSVTRIRIRATTVRNFDRKELIIPNKAFVTGNVLNWCLTDTIIRIVMPIGIAYGTDPQRAQNILLAVARQHPEVLDDPEPLAFFIAYGNSTLDYELRVFIASINTFSSTRQDLLIEIGKRFKAAGIEIAFPQRDLHIRSADPLLEAMRQGQLTPVPATKPMSFQAREAED